jgi:alpha-amylase
VKSICLVLYSHQPLILNHYRFYDIGKSSAYFNESTNCDLIQNLVKNKFAPVNKALMNIFQNGGNHFKVSFSFSGSTLDLLEYAAPEMIRDLKKMNEFGYIEFLSDTYSHSVLSKKYQKEFREQTLIQKQKVWNIFGQVPKAFLNISGYSLPLLSSILPDLGFKVLLQFNTLLSKTRNSPCYVYQEGKNNPIKVLSIKNWVLNDFYLPLLGSERQNKIDIDSFLNWVKELPHENEVICIALDYSNLISENTKESFLLDFIKKLPKKARKKGIGFCTPSELIYKTESESVPVSLIDESVKDELTQQELNIFQNEILTLLNQLKEKVYQTKNKGIIKTWFYLQDQGFFNELQAVNNVDTEKNHAVQSYITFRNILQDFTQRVEQTLMHGNAKFGSTDENPKPWEGKHSPILNSEQFNRLF